MKLSYRFAKWMILILLFIETASATYLFHNHLQIINVLSVVYFISGLCIAIIPVFYYSVNGIVSPNARELNAQKIFVATFFLSALGYSLPLISKLFEVIKIDYHSADMIPAIQVFCTRWLHHQTVYAPIQEIWNGEIVFYLPFMWLPFAPTILLNVDARWTTVTFFFIGLGLILWMFHSAKINWVQLLIILTLIGNLIYIQTDYNYAFFVWTEEGVIVGFYVFLGYALSRKNPWLISLAVTFCLLSRYALIFWIPCYLLFQFLTGERKRTIIQTSVIILLTLLIFIIPFFIKDPSYFINSPKLYAEAMKNLWIQNPEDLQNSLGFAKFFTVSQIFILHNLNIFLAVTVPLLFYLVLFFFRKNSKLNLAFAGLAGLKLTLTFFYGFIEAPFFYYLFMVPTIFSFVLVLHFFNPRTQLRNSIL